MIKDKTYKLDKMRLQLEYELNYVENAELRDIIRYRYNDNKTWLQIMFLMNYNSGKVYVKWLRRKSKNKIKKIFRKKLKMYVLYG